MVKRSPGYLVLESLEWDTICILVSRYSLTREPTAGDICAKLVMHAWFDGHLMSVVPSPRRQILPVAEGTFSAYCQHLVSDSSVFGQQFKQPRVLRAERQVQFFLDRRLPTE